MRKVFIFCACSVFMLIGCMNQGGKVEKDRQALRAAVELLDADSTLTVLQYEDKYFGLLEKTYEKHMHDSLGLETFRELAACRWDFNRLSEEYEKADTLIRGNSRIKRYLQIAEVRQNTSCGAEFIDIEGIELQSGEAMKVSDFIGRGNPVIIDFWASWCPDCRKAIKRELADYYSDNESTCTLISVAVWEKNQNDTKKAMEDLSVEWPVIYTGGRENSPSELYGITSIPSLVMIDNEGVIIGRGTSLESLPLK